MDPLSPFPLPFLPLVEITPPLPLFLTSPPPARALPRPRSRRSPWAATRRRRPRRRRPTTPPRRRRKRRRRCDPPPLYLIGLLPCGLRFPKGVSVSLFCLAKGEGDWKGGCRPARFEYPSKCGPPVLPAPAAEAGRMERAVGGCDHWGKGGLIPSGVAPLPPTAPASPSPQCEEKESGGGEGGEGGPSPSLSPPPGEQTGRRHPFFCPILALAGPSQPYYCHLVVFCGGPVPAFMRPWRGPHPRPPCEEGRWPRVRSPPSGEGRPGPSLLTSIEGGVGGVV